MTHFNADNGRILTPPKEKSKNMEVYHEKMV